LSDFQEQIYNTQCLDDKKKQAALLLLLIAPIMLSWGEAEQCDDCCLVSVS
jgi:hypothetical protein